MNTQPSLESNEGRAGNLWEDDARLVSECLKGEQEAWNELLSKYKNLIFSIPVKHGFSQEEAADVFQSVCLDLCNELANLREPRALAGWLIRVTHNRCFRFMKERRREVPQEEVSSDPPVPSEEIPDNVFHELEQEQLLRGAIRRLNERCQKLVKMLFFVTPPLPYEEIAKSMTLATGSIGFIRARCLEKLRRNLVEMGFE